jgi:hypothetical protein
MTPNEIVYYVAFYYSEFIQGIDECDRDFARSYEEEEQNIAYEIGRQLGRSYFKESEVI